MIWIWSLSVLKDGLRPLSYFVKLLKNTQQDCKYQFKLFHILITNRIQLFLYDGINFLYDKSQNFVELILESWIFFHKKSYVNKDNQINFVNYKITFQRFGKVQETWVQKKTLFYVFNRVLVLQMTVCHFWKWHVVLNSFLVYI